MSSKKTCGIDYFRWWRLRDETASKGPQFSELFCVRYRLLQVVALAGPSSCVDMVPSAERYRGVPNRAQSLQMADLEPGALSRATYVLCDPKPRF